MTNQLSQIHSHVQHLPAKARHDFNFWKMRIEPLLDRGDERGICEALKMISATTGEPLRTVQRKFYNARKFGLLALIDRRLCGPRFWHTSDQRRISDADESIVKTYCENNQRSSRQAAKKMRMDWRRGLIKTETPIDPKTGFPRGWSIDNLARYVAEQVRAEKREARPHGSGKRAAARLHDAQRSIRRLALYARRSLARPFRRLARRAPSRPAARTV
jgi:hypothetical protein